MADGTSVGKVQFDIEINQSSLNAELNKLGKVFSNGFNNNFKGMFSGMASQMNGFVKSSIGKMNSGFKSFSQSGAGANEKVSKSVNKMNSEYDKTEAKIAEIRNELTKLFAEQDNISRTFQDMPAFSGMTKEASMEQMLKSNPRYQELSEQIDKLTTKMDPLIDKNKTLADEINNVGSNAKNTGQTISLFGKNTSRAGNEAKKSAFKIKLFGDEMKKSGVKTAGFAAMINRSFMTILKRLFVYNLILKAIRSLMSYINGALKTNRQFVSSLNTVRTNLRVAFQPIYDFILPALNILMKAVAKATAYIATAISALFGKSYKQSYDSAKGIETAKKAMDGYEKSAKKARGQLAGFDEINVLDVSKDEDSGNGGADGFEMEMPDTSTIDLSGMERFKEIMASILEPFKLAWANEGQGTIDSMKIAFSSLLGLIGSIGKSWAEVWTNGTGQVILENILKIIQNIFDIVGNLATAFKNAWEENEVGTRIIQGMLDIFNTVLETIKRITESTAEWAKTLDFTPLLNSIDGLLQALKPLTQNIGDGLVWLWENALLPLAGWVIEDAIPVFLGMLAEAIKVLNNVIEALKPLGQWLWENFLLPLAEWTGGIIVSVLDEIKDALKGIGDWVINNEEKVQAFFAIFTTWKATSFVIEMAKATTAIVSHTTQMVLSKSETLILMGLYAKDAIAKGISTAATWGQVAATTAWNGIAAIATGVTTALGAAMAFITSPIGLVVVAITAAIAIGIALYKNWDEVSNFLKKIWEGIKTAAEKIWKAMSDFFSKTWEDIKSKTSEIWDSIVKYLSDKWNGIKTTATTIFNNIKDTISNIFNTIKTTASTVWDGITGGLKTSFDTIYNNSVTIFNRMKDFIKGITDSIEGFFKGMVNGVIRALNSMIGGLNKLNVDIPDWVPGLGGKSLGFNIPNIPYLAKGGIIDQPTLAMVGERGKEAVMPLENNTGWITELATKIAGMLGVSNQGGNGQPIYLTIKIGEDTLLEYLIDAINRENRIKGETVVSL